MSKKRVSPALQVALIVAFGVSWFCWRRFSSDWGGNEARDGKIEDSEEDIFSNPKPEISSTSEIDAFNSVPLEVDYGGCSQVIAAGADEVECIYDPEGDLKVWVTHPRADEAWVKIDGGSSSLTSYSKYEEPGLGFVVELANEDAERLSVGIPGLEEWSLRLRSQTRLTQIERRKYQEAIDTVIELETFLVHGNVVALDDVRNFVAKTAESGFISVALESVLVASYHLTEAPGRPDLALQLINEHRSLAERYPRGRAAWSIYRGTALLAAGRLVDAAASYRVGGRLAVRMMDVGLQIDALSHYSMTLAQLGYFEASVYWGAVVLALAREHGRSVDLAEVLETVAEASLHLREAGRTHDDPRPLLNERLELYRSGWPRMGLAELAVLDKQPERALEHLELFDKFDPKFQNEDLRARAIELRLRALLGQKGSDPREIRATLAKLESMAEAAVTADLRWRALLRRGEVLEREGDLDAAQVAYEQAEDILDRTIPLALLGVSGEVAPARHREGAHRLVSLLLRRDRSADALCVLRQAQSRVGSLARLFPRLDPGARASLRPRVESYMQAKRAYEALLRGATTLPASERDRVHREAMLRRHELDGDALEILATQAGYRGRPRCDELSPRREGEILMGLYPYDGNLLVLVQDHEGTTHRVFSDYDDIAHPDNIRWLGSVLLDPIGEQLAAATRMRVFASDEAAAIDVHALPWREMTLVEQLPVVYGLDLPLSGSQDHREGSSEALVLADRYAKGTLVEVNRVEVLLDEAGWTVGHLDSDEQVAHQLRQELSHVKHFHYAGHAYYNTRPPGRQTGAPGAEVGGDAVLRLWPPYPGGAASEPAYIPLGKAGRLDVQDILMMEHVPRSVVLMGCATGVHDERMAYGGFSLATAFLAAGANVVVASTREVDGNDASLIGQGLYAEFSGPAALVEPGTWFASAVRWARERGLPELAIRDYRVFVP